MSERPRIFRDYLGEAPVISADTRRVSCFFTGHRDFAPDDASSALLSETVDSLIRLGVTHFYAGGARGFDTFAEITVLNRRLKNPSLTLTLALPFDGYRHVSDRIMKARFEAITGICDEIVYLRPAYSPDCYQARNIYMADRSAYCVSWQTRPGGGTANAVNYARRAEVRIIELAKAAGSVPDQG